METFYFTSVVAFDSLILLEYLYSKISGKKLFTGKDAWASISMYWGWVLISLVWLPLAHALYGFAHSYAIWPLLEPQWYHWLLLIVLEDFCFYWFHRCSHHIRILWASHVNHHSSEEYNLTTAVRQTWTPFYAFIFWMPLPWLGFPPHMVIWVQAASLLYQSLLHTKVINRLGIFEYFMNTPSHHRVHHASNVGYLDRNCGGVFIIWDRLFGTFAKEVEPVKYGLTHDINTYNPFKIAMHEYISIYKHVKQARSLKEIFGYIFFSPGWSPAPLVYEKESRSAHVENNLGIILLYSLLLFVAVMTSQLWLPIENGPWLVYVLLMICFSIIFFNLRTVRSRTARNIAAAPLLATLLSVPFTHGLVYPHSSSLAAFSSVFGVLFTLKTLSFLKKQRDEISYFHFAYFLAWAPNLVFDGAFHQVADRKKNMFRGLLQVVQALFLLAGAIFVLNLLTGYWSLYHEDLFIPLAWHTLPYSSLEFWIVVASKGLCLYLFLNAFLRYYTGYFNIFSLGFRDGFRWPLLQPSPAAFWRNFNGAMAAWSTSLLSHSLRASLGLTLAKVFVGFGVSALSLSYFFIAIELNPSWYFYAFFGAQALLVAVELLVRQLFRLRRSKSLKLAVLAPLNWAWIIATSVYFFKVWDQLFM